MTQPRFVMLVNSAEPPESMGPKIEAAIEYLQAEDGSVIITDTPYLNDALEGKAGTTITRA